MGVVLQIQARVDVEIVPSAAQVTLVKDGALSFIWLRVWNMDLDKRTRKIDTISKTEDASTQCTNKRTYRKMASNMKFRKATLREKRKPRELRKRNKRSKQH